MLLAPFRAVISKPARRVYLQTILLALTSLLLLFIAIVSYLIFYANYIPHIGVTKPVHLNYYYNSNSVKPSGVVNFPSQELITNQPYDVTLHLRLPTSPENLNRGNFMCFVYIFDTPSPNPTRRTPNYFFAHADAKEVSKKTLLWAFRPAIMTYSTPLLRTMKTLITAPLLLTGLKKQEEVLKVVMAEATSFSAIPRSAVVEVDPDLAVYEARLEFVARFSGLRWFMYSWRLTSFVVLTGLFWGTAVLWALVAWYWVSAWLQERIESEGAVAENYGDRAEDTESMEDQEYGGQHAGSRGRGAMVYPTPEATPAPEETPGDWTPTSGDSRVGDDDEDYEDEDYEDEDLDSGMVEVGRAMDTGLGTTSESTGTSRHGDIRRRTKAEQEA
jgi:seipin